MDSNKELVYYVSAVVAFPPNDSGIQDLLQHLQETGAATVTSVELVSREEAERIIREAPNDF